MRKDSGIKRPPDLKGKKACFPILEGVGKPINNKIMVCSNTLYYKYKGQPNANVS